MPQATTGGQPTRRKDGAMKASTLSSFTFRPPPPPAPHHPQALNNPQPQGVGGASVRIVLRKRPAGIYDRPGIRTDRQRPLASLPFDRVLFPSPRQDEHEPDETETTVIAKRAVFVSSISQHNPRHETLTATTNGVSKKTIRPRMPDDTERNIRPSRPTHRKTRRTRRDDARAMTTNE